MKKKIIYVGNLPEPFGGVTIKNKLLYDSINEVIGIDHLIQKEDIFKLSTISLLFSKSKFIVGLSGSRGLSRFFSILLFLVNSSALKESVYMMMGGVEAKKISKSKFLTYIYKKYKRVYVELPVMAATLREVGFDNISVYPNCRVAPSSLNTKKFNKFTCVFMSKVSKEKGVDTIIEVAKKTPDVDFHFFGDIEPDYFESFNTSIGELDNVEYLGVHKNNPVINDVCTTLSKYQLHLFPTKWKTEGIPGILIEAMFSGVPSIVSDESLNSHIILHGKNGLVMEENTADCLRNCIDILLNNDELKRTMDETTLKLSEEYNIEKYIGKIVEDLNHEQA